MPLLLKQLNTRIKKYTRVGTVCLAALGLSHTSLSIADNLRADINDDTFKFEYEVQGSELGINASALAHEDNGEIYALGTQVQGATLQNQAIQGSLGGKLYYIDLENDISGFAVGLGGSVSIAFADVEGLSLQLQGFYAPGVLSFNDIDHHTDISLRALYQVLSNGAVYVGYRKAHIDVDGGGSGNLDSGGHIGLQLDF